VPPRCRIPPSGNARFAGERSESSVPSARTSFGGAQCARPSSDRARVHTAIFLIDSGIFGQQYALMIDGTTNYQPHLIDWRFLPRPLLYLKDLARFHAQKMIRHRPDSSIGVRRSIDRIKQAGVLFVHIPKTGGTSISKLLYGRNLPHRSAAAYFEALGGRGIPSFSVIRDPVERFISTYRFVKAGGSSIIATNSYETAWVRRFASADELALALGDDPWRLEGLTSFVKQCHFVLDDHGRMNVDQLYSLDKGSGFSEPLITRFGKPDKVNVTRGPFVEISDTTIELVRKLYSEDKRLFDSITGRGGELQASDWCSVD